MSTPPLLYLPRVIRSRSGTKPICVSREHLAVFRHSPWKKMFSNETSVNRVLRDLRFSQWRFSRLGLSGVWYSVARYAVSDVSKQRSWTSGLLKIKALFPRNIKNRHPTKLRHFKNNNWILQYNSMCIVSTACFCFQGQAIIRRTLSLYTDACSINILNAGKRKQPDECVGQRIPAGRESWPVFPSNYFLTFCYEL